MLRLSARDIDGSVSVYAEDVGQVGEAMAHLLECTDREDWWIC